MTKESSWCPRQIPKTGLGWSTQTTFLTLLMVFWQSWGSPGPLLMNKPSKSTKREGGKAPCLPLMKEMYHIVNISEQYWPLIDCAKDVELLICSIQSSNKLLHLWDLVCFVLFNSINMTSSRSFHETNILHLITHLKHSGYRLYTPGKQLVALSVRPTCAIQWVVPRYDSDAGSSLSQAADLVVFDAAVDHCDPQTTGGVENSRLLETINGEVTKIRTM